MLIITYKAMANTDDQLLTVEQVAEHLQVHWQTVLNYIKSGKIEAIKLGKGYRIPKECLANFINVNKTNGQSK